MDPESEDQPLNLAKAAQYEDFLSLWDTKQAANAKQLAQINKSATKTYLKPGDIVMDRPALKSNKKYDTNPKNYYSVLLVKGPTCAQCIGEKFQCPLCRIQPTTSVKLLNLQTGNTTSRNVQKLVPLPRGQILDPQFAMNLPQVKAYNRHHHSDLGHFFRPEEPEEEPRYSLRSHQVIGDFLVIHDEVMDHPTVAEATHVAHPPRSDKKTILSKNKSSTITNEIMIDNIMDFVSGDQLPSLMAGMQFHLDLANEYSREI